jgi:hypothetical protein
MVLTLLSNDEKKEKKRLANKKYRSTKNGKAKTAESSKKYSQTDKYKEYKRRYMREYMRKYNKQDN